MTREKGIFWLSLVDQDRDNLQEQVPQVFEKVAEHLHITLQYNVTLTEQIAQFLWTAPIEIRILSNCFNDRIQAVRVQLPEHIRVMCQNANPHMTISMVKGARPVLSNLMLEGPHEETPLETSLFFRFQFHTFN